jgi:N-acetyl-anhydromuramyl-L-alanine amidase AmpD
VRIPGIPFHQGRNDYDDGDDLHFGIAIHNTSNTASDTNEASYADHRTDGTSSHFYVDADSVTQSLDTADKAGHAGSREGNENAIAFELTGTNDRSRQWWLDNIAWAKLGYVIAYILRYDPDYRGFQVRRASVAEMQANPKVKAFYGHDDMRRAWGGTNHTDPGGNFPWDRLFAAVNAALNPQKDEDDEMSFANQQILPDLTSVAVPGGDAAWRPTWLVFTNDTFGKLYALRVFTTKGDGNWAPITGDGLIKCESGKVHSYPLPEQTRCVSIQRMAVNELGRVVAVVHEGEVGTPRSTYAGPLSFALER